MKRLTRIDEDGDAYLTMETLGAGVDRLAAYEDTGLMPEEVAAMKLALMGKSVAEIAEFDGVSVDRLRELAGADKDGRVVVLPCKVGDTVYCAAHTRVQEACVEQLCMETDGKLYFDVHFECDFDCSSCAFKAWRQDYSGEHSCDGEYGTSVIQAEKFGKTVFLTREAAEAALKENETCT